MNAVKKLAVVAAVACLPFVVNAQTEFRLAGRTFQMHSFASQGFAYTNNDNNYLTMKTSAGSSAFTDAGANISTQLTEKLRVGAQIYVRNVGRFGNWRPGLDWAAADYRFKDWFGIRGGKVKTVLGLYNDTQDMEFLHPWALMPASVYPVDARGDTIAHIGGDVYGNISLRKLGGLGYTGYAGRLPRDMEGGFVYGLETQAMANTPFGRQLVPVAGTNLGKKIDSYGGPAYGGDLKWTTPLKGFLAGASVADLSTAVTGTILSNNRAYQNYTVIDRIYAFYAQYTVGNLNLDGEYRKENRNNAYNNAAGVLAMTLRNSRQGYLSASYRLSKWLEVGTYHSRFILNWEQNHGDPRNHIFDQAVTARFDLNKFVDLKLEEHFMDGAMVTNGLNRGFYLDENRRGLQPQTKLLMVRLGFHM